MRWEPKEPELGDRRVRKRFLFWPMEIGGELRWLEFAAWIEEYIFPGNGIPWRWEPMKWIDAPSRGYTPIPPYIQVRPSQDREPLPNPPAGARSGEHQT